MENIKLNENLINKLFGGLDSDCLEQVKALVEQGAVLNPLNGEIVLNNTGTEIFTDYFSSAFFIDEDERPYSKSDANLCIASRKNPYGDDYQYICIEESPRGSDGWDSAMAWDPNSKECYGTECRVYQFQIETAEDEWESYPIWFESRDDATIYFDVFIENIGDMY